MDLTKLTVENTTSGGVAAFTTTRVGGGEKPVEKPVEKAKKTKGTGLKPDALVTFVKGYRKA